MNPARANQLLPSEPKNIAAGSPPGFSASLSMSAQLIVLQVRDAQLEQPEKSEGAYMFGEVHAVQDEIALDAPRQVRLPARAARLAPSGSSAA